MRCSTAEEALLNRVDGPLSPELGAALGEHLEGCAACRGFGRRLDAVEGALLLQAPARLEAEDIERSVSVIRERLVQPPVGRPRRAWIPTTALAAAAALLLLTLLAPRDESDEPTTPTTTEVRPEAQVAQATPAEPATAPLAPEAPATTDAELDGERLRRARAAVRVQVARAAADLGETPDRDAITRLVEEVDGATAALRADEWPVVRLVAMVLEDEDASVASAAARYLGRRGDRLTDRRLERALGREGVAEAALEALGEAGARTQDELGRALALPGLRERALQLLHGQGGEAAARALAGALLDERREAPGLPPSADLLEALVALDEAAVDALLEASAEGALDEQELCTALAAMPASPAVLSARLLDERDPRRLELVTSCASSLAPVACRQWVLENLTNPRHGELARACLPRLAGGESLVALRELDLDRRLRGVDLDALVLATLEVDAQRLALHLEQLSGAGEFEEHAALCLLLLRLQDPLALPGLRTAARATGESPELRRDLILAIAELGEAEDATLALELFAGRDGSSPVFAAACLLAAHQLGGEEAVRSALPEASERDLKDLLELLRRRRRSSSVTSTLYKLARELRPFPVSRGPDRSSS